MSAPKEIDRADVLNELVHRWYDAAADSGDKEPGASWVLDQLAYMGHLTFQPRPLCGVAEGMTGIACQLPKGHVMPDGSLRTVHEGKTTPEQTAYVGYEMSVRWPLAGTLLPEAEPERSAGCQNHWPVEDAAAQREGAVLHVHGTVWKSLVAYLDSVGVAVHDVSLHGDKQPTFFMDPKVGAWPSE